jgi:GMP reductase
LKTQETKLDFNDLLIVPKASTNISTRTVINLLDKNGYLPLITAPMDTVIDIKNAKLYDSLKVNVCTPRSENSGFGFYSYSYNGILELLIRKQLLPNGKYLIDVANGHIDKICNITKTIKDSYPSLTLMVGNVANPETYKLLSNAGADYVRIGIGNGGGCLTTQNTGIGYPMASLIRECYEISCQLEKPAFIVADGGMKDYSDIIKALALGADYVMLGNIFNKSLESSGQNYLWKYIKIPQSIAKILYKCKFSIYKKFRGMSTKEVQKKWGAKKLKTSEGVTRYQKIQYTLPQWIENFEHYLSSAMSYTGAHSLKEFIGNVEIIKITNNSFKRFNK